MSAIDEIKQKLDIVELVGQYIQLQKSGRNFRALCPFHSEKTPSFFIFPEQQSWHCFGACGTGGDIYSFIMKKEGLDFGQALRLLAERAGVTLVSPELQNKEADKERERLIQINEAAAAYYHYLLMNTTAGERAANYLAQRSISSQTITDFQLGFSKDSFEDIRQHLLAKSYDETDLLTAGLVLKRDGGGYYDRFRNRLMFPIRDIKGSVIGFGARSLDESLPKYLNSPQTPVFDKSGTLYAIDRAKESIRKKNEAVIMEGYMDVLTAHQNGWDNTVASMGTALTEKQLSMIKRLTKNLILALDADSAGEKARQRTEEILDRPLLPIMLRTDDSDSDKFKNNIFDFDVKVVIPSQGKDPDEEIRKDPSLWTQSLGRAKPMMDFIFDIAKEKINSGNIKDKASVVDWLLQIIYKIENSIIQGYYIQEVARILKCRSNDLRDRLTKLKLDERKQRPKGVDSPISPKGVSLSIDPLEDYCLWLLLQYPGLRTEGMKLNPDFFGFNETKEILLKWQQNADINSLKANLDSTLHPYLDSLLNKMHPPIIKEDEAEQRKILNNCIMRLQEKLFKNLEAKKRELLSMEAETGGKEAELAKIEELGIEESQQLKRVFAERSRRHSTG